MRLAYGILEDDLEVPADLLHLVAAEDRRLLAGLALRLGRDVEEDLVLDGDLARRGREQAQDDLAEGGLAAAGLADQAEGLALADVERDAVHGADRADLA